MTRMVGRGSAGWGVAHKSDRGRRNRDDRKQWRDMLYRYKRRAKSREKRDWRDEAENDIRETE